MLRGTGNYPPGVGDIDISDPHPIPPHLKWDDLSDKQQDTLMDGFLDAYGHDLVMSLQMAAEQRSLKLQVGSSAEAGFSAMKEWREYLDRKLGETNQTLGSAVGVNKRQ